MEFLAIYELEKIFDEEKAKEVFGALGDKATVTKVTASKITQPAPYPFDLTSLQTEAYKHLTIDPRRTLEIAQSLYTNAIISYPRTSSQQIPDDIDSLAIVESIKKQKKYEKPAQAVLDGKNKIPIKGKKDDPAHPAIHPTGEHPGKIGKDEERL